MRRPRTRGGVFAGSRQLVDGYLSPVPTARTARILRVSLVHGAQRNVAAQLHGVRAGERLPPMFQASHRSPSQGATEGAAAEGQPRQGQTTKAGSLSRLSAGGFLTGTGRRSSNSRRRASQTLAIHSADGPSVVHIRQNIRIFVRLKWELLCLKWELPLADGNASRILSPIKGLQIWPELRLAKLPGNARSGAGRITTELSPPDER
jgi:hypothetical protein